MPLYSYHCKSCDKDAELLIRSDETPACPACGGVDLQRLVSRVVAPGKFTAIKRGMRAAAAAEGHTSNFSRSER